MKRKVIAIITIFCFVFSFVIAQPLQASLERIRDINSVNEILDGFMLPASVGRITDNYSSEFGVSLGREAEVQSSEFKNQGFGSSPGLRTNNSNTVVINIQDLHCHPEVQRNISKIISIIDNKYHIKHVYIEGAYGSVDTSWLTGVKDKELNAKVLEVLMETGKLSGSEYYAALSGRNDLLFGVDDKRLHCQNVLRLNTIVSEQEQINQKIENLARDLEVLKNIYYDADNKRLDTILKKYKNGAINPKKFYKALAKYSLELDIDIRDYKNTSEFIKTFDRSFDYKKVSKELQALLGLLKQKLPYQAYQNLAVKTANFSQLQYLCLYLPKIAAKYKLDISNDYPNLKKFFDYLEISQGINSIKLISEEYKLLNEIRLRLARKKSERDIIFLIEFSRYLKDYLSYKSSSEDYDFVRENLSKFELLWKQYIGNNKLSQIKDSLGLLEDYYQVNLKRNECLLNNCMNGRVQGAGLRVQALNETAFQHKQDVSMVSKPQSFTASEQDDIVVLVTGGFHTQGISVLMKERGIPYIVITPNVTQDNAFSESVYAELLQAQTRIIKAASQRMNQPVQQGTVKGLDSLQIVVLSALGLLDKVPLLADDLMAGLYKDPKFNKNGKLDIGASNRLFGQLFKEIGDTGKTNVLVEETETGYKLSIHYADIADPDKALVKTIAYDKKCKRITGDEAVASAKLSPQEVRKALRNYVQKNKWIIPKDILTTLEDKAVNAAGLGYIGDKLKKGLSMLLAETLLLTAGTIAAKMLIHVSLLTPSPVSPIIIGAALLLGAVFSFMHSDLYREGLDRRERILLFFNRFLGGAGLSLLLFAAPLELAIPLAAGIHELWNFLALAGERYRYYEGRNLGKLVLKNMRVLSLSGPQKLYEVISGAEVLKTLGFDVKKTASGRLVIDKKDYELFNELKKSHASFNRDVLKDFPLAQSYIFSLRAQERFVKTVLEFINAYQKLPKEKKKGYEIGRDASGRANVEPLGQAILFAIKQHYGDLIGADNILKHLFHFYPFIRPSDLSNKKLLDDLFSIKPDYKNYVETAAYALATNDPVLFNLESGSDRVLMEALDRVSRDRSITVSKLWAHPFTEEGQILGQKVPRKSDNHIVLGYGELTRCIKEAGKEVETAGKEGRPPRKHVLIIKNVESMQPEVRIMLQELLNLRETTHPEFGTIRLPDNFQILFTKHEGANLQDESFYDRLIVKKVKKPAGFKPAALTAFPEQVNERNYTDYLRIDRENSAVFLVIDNTKIPLSEGQFGTLKEGLKGEDVLDAVHERSGLILDFDTIKMLYFYHQAAVTKTKILQLQGATGVGKTYTAGKHAKSQGKDFYSGSTSEGTELADFIGGFEMDASGALSFNPSTTFKERAEAENGSVIALSEFNTLIDDQERTALAWWLVQVAEAKPGDEVGDITIRLTEVPVPEGEEVKVIRISPKTQIVVDINPADYIARGIFPDVWKEYVPVITVDKFVTGNESRKESEIDKLFLYASMYLKHGWKTEAGAVKAPGISDAKLRGQISSTLAFAYLCVVASYAGGKLGAQEKKIFSARELRRLCEDVLYDISLGKDEKTAVAKAVRTHLVAGWKEPSDQKTVIEALQEMFTYNGMKIRASAIMNLFESPKKLKETRSFASADIRAEVLALVPPESLESLNKPTGFTEFVTDQMLTKGRLVHINVEPDTDLQHEIKNLESSVNGTIKTIPVTDKTDRFMLEGGLVPTPDGLGTVFGQGLLGKLREEALRDPSKQVVYILDNIHNMRPEDAVALNEISQLPANAHILMISRSPLLWSPAEQSRYPLLCYRQANEYRRQYLAEKLLNVLKVQHKVSDIVIRNLFNLLEKTYQNLKNDFAGQPFQVQISHRKFVLFLARLSTMIAETPRGVLNSALLYEYIERAFELVFLLDFEPVQRAALSRKFLRALVQYLSTSQLTEELSAQQKMQFPKGVELVQAQFEFENGKADAVSRDAAAGKIADILKANPDIGMWEYPAPAELEKGDIVRTYRAGKASGDVPDSHKRTRAQTNDGKTWATGYVFDEVRIHTLDRDGNHREKPLDYASIALKEKEDKDKFKDKYKGKRIRTIALSSDGKTMVVGADDAITGGKVLIFNINDLGEPVYKALVPIFMDIKGIALSSDGRTLMTSDNLWTNVYTLSSEGEIIKESVINDDGTVTDEEKKDTMTSLDDEIIEVSMSISGNVLAIGKYGGVTNVYQMGDDGKPVMIGKINAGTAGTNITSLSVSGDGKTIVVTTGNKQVRVFHRGDDGAIPLLPAAVIDFDEDSIKSIAVSDDGKTLVLAHYNLTGNAQVEVYTINSYAEPFAVLQGSLDVPARQITQVAMNADGSNITVSGDDGKTYDFEKSEFIIEDNEIVLKLDSKERIPRRSLSEVCEVLDTHSSVSTPLERIKKIQEALYSTKTADGIKRIAAELRKILKSRAAALSWKTADTDKLAVSDVMYGYGITKNITDFDGSLLESAALSGDGKTIIKINASKEMSICSASADNSFIRGSSLGLQSNFIDVLAVSEDGGTVVLRNRNGDSFLMINGEIRIFPGLVPLNSGAAVSQDGSTVVFNTKKGKTYVFKINYEGEEAKISNPRIIETELIADSVSLSSDGKTLVLGMADWNTRVYRLDNDRIPGLIATLSDAKSSITSVAVAGDGSTIAVGSKDKKVYVYRVGQDGTVNQSPAVALEDAANPITSVSMNRDGTALIASDGSENLCIYNLEYGENISDKPSVLKSRITAAEKIQSASITLDGSAILAISSDKKTFLIKYAPYLINNLALATNLDSEERINLERLSTTCKLLDTKADMTPEQRLRQAHSEVINAADDIKARALEEMRTVLKTSPLSNALEYRNADELQPPDIISTYKIKNTISTGRDDEMINSLAQNDKYIVGGCSDGKVRVYAKVNDKANPDPVAFCDIEDSIISTAISGDTIIIGTSNDKKECNNVYIFRIGEREGAVSLAPVSRLSIEGKITDVVSDGNTLVVAAYTDVAKAHVYSMNKDKTIHELLSSINCPDGFDSIKLYGNTLAVSKPARDNTETVYMYRVEKNSSEPVDSFVIEESVPGLAIYEDFVVVLGFKPWESGVIMQIYNRKERKITESVSIPYLPTAIERDGNTLVVGTENGYVYVYGIVDGKISPEAIQEMHVRGGVVSLAVSDDTTAVLNDKGNIYLFGKTPSYIIKDGDKMIQIETGAVISKTKLPKLCEVVKFEQHEAALPEQKPFKQLYGKKTFYFEAGQDDTLYLNFNGKRYKTRHTLIKSIEKQGEYTPVDFSALRNPYKEGRLPCTKQDFLMRTDLLAEVEDSIVQAFAEGWHVDLEGPPGGGKTSIGREMAMLFGLPRHLFQMHGERELADLIGGFKEDSQGRLILTSEPVKDANGAVIFDKKDGKPHYRQKFLECLVHGGVYIFDEGAVGEQGRELLSWLSAVGRGDTEIYLEEFPGRTIKLEVSKDFHIVITNNTLKYPLKSEIASNIQFIYVDEDDSAPVLENLFEYILGDNTSLPKDRKTALAKIAAAVYWDVKPLIGKNLGKEKKNRYLVSKREIRRIASQVRKQVQALGPDDDMYILYKSLFVVFEVMFPHPEERILAHRIIQNRLGSDLTQQFEERLKQEIKQKFGSALTWTEACAAFVTEAMFDQDEPVCYIAEHDARAQDVIAQLADKHKAERVVIDALPEHTELEILGGSLPIFGGPGSKKSMFVPGSITKYLLKQEELENQAKRDEVIVWIRNIDQWNEEIRTALYGLLEDGYIELEDEEGSVHTYYKPPWVHLVSDLSFDNTEDFNSAFFNRWIKIGLSNEKPAGFDAEGKEDKKLKSDFEMVLEKGYSLDPLERTILTNLYAGLKEMDEKPYWARQARYDLGPEIFYMLADAIIQAKEENNEWQQLLLRIEELKKRGDTKFDPRSWSGRGPPSQKEAAALWDEYLRLEKEILAQELVTILGYRFSTRLYPSLPSDFERFRDVVQNCLFPVFGTTYLTLPDPAVHVRPEGVVESIGNVPLNPGEGALAPGKLGKDSLIDYNYEARKGLSILARAKRLGRAVFLTGGPGSLKTRLTKHFADITGSFYFKFQSHKASSYSDLTFTLAQDETGAFEVEMRSFYKMLEEETRDIVIDIDEANANPAILGVLEPLLRGERRIYPAFPGAKPIDIKAKHVLLTMTANPAFFSGRSEIGRRITSRMIIANMNQPGINDEANIIGSIFYGVNLRELEPEPEIVKTAQEEAVKEEEARITIKEEVPADTGEDETITGYEGVEEGHSSVEPAVELKAEAAKGAKTKAKSKREKPQEAKRTKPAAQEQAKADETAEEVQTPLAKAVQEALTNAQAQETVANAAADKVAAKDKQFEGTSAPGKPAVGPGAKAPQRADSGEYSGSRKMGENASWTREEENPTPEQVREWQKKTEPAYGVFSPEIYPNTRYNVLNKLKVTGNKITLSGQKEPDYPGGRVSFTTAPERDLKKTHDFFDGTFPVEALSSSWQRVPSAGAGMLMLSAEAVDENGKKTAVELEFAKDSADNYYVRSPKQAVPVKATLKYRVAVRAAYFSSEIPDGTFTWKKDIPEPVVEALELIGIKQGDSYQKVVFKLTDFFRNKVSSTKDIENITGNVYLDIIKSPYSKCDQRTFAFVVTALSLGIDARMVITGPEKHAYPEIFVPFNDLGWVRLGKTGLGGGGDPMKNDLNQLAGELHSERFKNNLPVPDQLIKESERWKERQEKAMALQGIKPQIKTMPAASSSALPDKIESLSVDRQDIDRRVRYGVDGTIRGIVQVIKTNDPVSAMMLQGQSGETWFVFNRIVSAVLSKYRTTTKMVRRGIGEVDVQAVAAGKDKKIKIRRKVNKPRSVAAMNLIDFSGSQEPRKNELEYTISMIGRRFWQVGQVIPHNFLWDLTHFTNQAFKPAVALGESLTEDQNDERIKSMAKLIGKGGTNITAALYWKLQDYLASQEAKNAEVKYLVLVTDAKDEEAGIKDGKITDVPVKVGVDEKTGKDIEISLKKILEQYREQGIEIIAIGIGAGVKDIGAFTGPGVYNVRIGQGKNYDIALAIAKIAELKITGPGTLRDFGGDITGFLQLADPDTESDEPLTSLLDPILKAAARFIADKGFENATVYVNVLRNLFNAISGLWEEPVFRYGGLMVIPSLLGCLGVAPLLALGIGLVWSGPVFLFLHTFIRWLVRSSPAVKWQGWKKELAGEFFVPVPALKRTLPNTVMSFVKSQAFATIIYNAVFIILAGSRALACGMIPAGQLISLALVAAIVVHIAKDMKIIWGKQLKDSILIKLHAKFKIGFHELVHATEISVLKGQQDIDMQRDGFISRTRCGINVLGIAPVTGAEREQRLRNVQGIIDKDFVQITNETAGIPAVVFKGERLKVFRELIDAGDGSYAVLLRFEQPAGLEALSDEDLSEIGHQVIGFICNNDKFNKELMRYLPGRNSKKALKPDIVYAEGKLAGYMLPGDDFEQALRYKNTLFIEVEKDKVNAQGNISAGADIVISYDDVTRLDTDVFIKTKLGPAYRTKLRESMISREAERIIEVRLGANPEAELPIKAQEQLKKICGGQVTSALTKCAVIRTLEPVLDPDNKDFKSREAQVLSARKKMKEQIERGYTVKNMQQLELLPFLLARTLEFWPYRFYVDLSGLDGLKEGEFDTLMSKLETLSRRNPDTRVIFALPLSLESAVSSRMEQRIRAVRNFYVERLCVLGQVIPLAKEDNLYFRIVYNNLLNEEDNKKAARRLAQSGAEGFVLMPLENLQVAQVLMQEILEGLIGISRPQTPQERFMQAYRRHGLGFFDEKNKPAIKIEDPNFSELAKIVRVYFTTYHKEFIEPQEKRTLEPLKSGPYISGMLAAVQKIIENEQFSSGELYRFRLKAERYIEKIRDSNGDEQLVLFSEFMGFTRGILESLYKGKDTPNFVTERCDTAYGAILMNAVTVPGTALEEVPLLLARGDYGLAVEIVNNEIDRIDKSAAADESRLRLVEVAGMLLEYRGKGFGLDRNMRGKINEFIVRTAEDYVVQLAKEGFLEGLNQKPDGLKALLYTTLNKGAAVLGERGDQGRATQWLAYADKILNNLKPKLGQISQGNYRDEDIPYFSAYMSLYVNTVTGSDFQIAVDKVLARTLESFIEEAVLPGGGWSVTELLIVLDVYEQRLPEFGDKIKETLGAGIKANLYTAIEVAG
ncbi:MAG: AAA family ATPase [Elusimicrobia bacterium]|nr:AAA family ATPase [Candidatus Liberimonas magnetica]